MRKADSRSAWTGECVSYCDGNMGDVRRIERGFTSRSLSSASFRTLGSALRVEEYSSSSDMATD